MPIMLIFQPPDRPGPAIDRPRPATAEALPGAQISLIWLVGLPMDKTCRVSRHLSVLLPGRGYGALGPALRLPRLAVKSLGTVILASLPIERVVPGSVKAIWLTPIFGRESVRSGVIAKDWPSLLVAGEADELHEPEHHDAIARAVKAESLVLPRADHALEIPGDVIATLDGFRTLTEKVLGFVH